LMSEIQLASELWGQFHAGAARSVAEPAPG
jgi:hypothetical protein